MRTKIAASIVLLFYLHASAYARDETIPFVVKDREMKGFLPVYRRYVTVIREQGAQGLKAIITPDFTLHWDKQALTSQKALAELDRYVSGLKDGTFSVKVGQLTIKGNKAVAMTEETATFRLSNSAQGSGTWYWKQTWRKTERGWKLAVSESLEKMKESSRAFIFTSPP